MLRNKTAEQDIRHYLATHGYYGRSARFDELELHAVGRPGWVQVFRFTVEARKQSGEWDRLLGALRDDQRSKSLKVFLSRSPFEQRQRLEMWSAGLIVAKGKRGKSTSDGTILWGQLAIVVGGIVTVLTVLSLLMGS